MALGDTDTFTADSTSDAPDYSSERGPISDASVSSPRPRTNAITISQPQTQPRRNEFDQPTLDRAYHTIDFLQRNPQWLANPYTQHAANALLAGSSKMIEMSIQLERVNAMADSAKLKLNTDTRLVNHLNDGMAKLKDLTVVAAIRDEVQANGPSPRAISLLNTQLAAENPIKPLETAGKIDYDRQQLINSGASPERIASFDKSAESQHGHGLLIKSQEDYLKTLQADPNADPDEVRRVTSRLERLSEGTQEKEASQLRVMDERYKHMVRMLPEKERSQERKDLTKGINTAEALALQVMRDPTNLESKYGTAESLQAKAKSYRQKLKVVDDVESESTGRPATPSAPASTNEVIKIAPNGKRAVFDADTKKFLRYAD